VDGNGIRTDPAKIETMVNYPRLTTVTQLKRFLGICLWYRRFIEHFSTLTSPLTDLTKDKKKKQVIHWSATVEKALKQIKNALVSSPVLCSTNFKQPFIIQCDASDTGLGGVITQNIKGNERVIAYASRTLSGTERNYSVTERECLAVVFCIEKFCPYVEGTHFTVLTDHYSLLWLN
jgi:hypothetical protein